MRRLLYDMSGDVKNFKCFFSKFYAFEDESTKFLLKYWKPVTQ
jgi:hypothetical protein